MKVGSRRIIALTGSALMVVGMSVSGAGAASAHDRDRPGFGHRPDRPSPSCTVELDKDRRGNLDVDVATNVRGANRAVVVADWDGRLIRDDRALVSLNRRGNGSTELNIPRRANGVEVTAYISDGRRGFVKCTNSLDLRRAPWWVNRGR